MFRKASFFTRSKIERLADFFLLRSKASKTGGVETRHAFVSNDTWSNGVNDTDDTDDADDADDTDDTDATPKC